MSETGNSGKIPYMNLSHGPSLSIPSKFSGAMVWYNGVSNFAITRTSSWCLFIAEGFLGVRALQESIDKWRWSALVKTGSCDMHRLNRRAFIHLLKCWTEAFHVEKGFKFLFFVIFYFSCFTKIWFSDSKSNIFLQFRKSRSMDTNQTINWEWPIPCCPQGVKGLKLEWPNVLVYIW